MAFFDKIWEQIFGKYQNPDQLLVVKEVVKHTTQQTEKYQEWLLSPASSALIENIRKAYYFKKTNIQSEIAVHLFQTTAAKGFAISFEHTIFAKNDLLFLIYLWREKILHLGYQEKNAEIQTTDKKNYVERIERYYLKPNTKKEVQATQRIDQRYGNLLLEYHWIDQKPSFCKLLATTYSDSLYQPAADYDELIEYLFS